MKLAGTMRSWTLREVQGVVELPRSTVRTLIVHGLVRPTRGLRREYRFSFQDLIVLRTARALIEARVPRSRMRRSLQRLRRSLPESLPLSGLQIRAVGDEVVVRAGRDRWAAADSGQILLGFEVSADPERLEVRAAPAVPLRPRQPVRPPPPDTSAEDAQAVFETALALEACDAAHAMLAYARCTQLDPGHAPAWINRGRLLHEAGRLEEAEKNYREGIALCTATALLHFNLGVVLEDLGRGAASIAAYQDALRLDPRLADAHYNLARLYESRGQGQHAIRHLIEYRRLTRRR